jgi:hypothetical protein
MLFYVDIRQMMESRDSIGPIAINPLRTEVYFCHQNQNAKKYW